LLPGRRFVGDSERRRLMAQARGYASWCCRRAVSAVAGCGVHAVPGRPVQCQTEAVLTHAQSMRASTLRDGGSAERQLSVDHAEAVSLNVCIGHERDVPSRASARGAAVARRRRCRTDHSAGPCAQCWMAEQPRKRARRGAWKSCAEAGVCDAAHQVSGRVGWLVCAQRRCVRAGGSELPDLPTWVLWLRFINHRQWAAHL
jgi:hypothetical protein